jgi:membrane protease subunit (stomatin/prohibitin family)
MFNLQVDAQSIAKGIEEDLDMELRDIGIGIIGFKIESFNYPDEVRSMQEKAAAQSMVGDVNKYSQIAMANSVEKGNGGASGANLAGQMMGVSMGMMMGQQLMNNTNNNAAPGAGAKFCSNCGTPVNGGRFCSNCGQKLG